MTQSEAVCSSYTDSMDADEELVKAVRKAAERRSSADRDWIEDLIGKYDTACYLSRGPVAYRSKHWAYEAHMLTEKLRNIVSQTDIRTNRFSAPE